MRNERHETRRYSRHVLLEEVLLQFDAGLSLREQSRNAVRHALGGTRFRARALQLPLPAALIDFVVLPARHFAEMYPQLNF